MPWHVEPEHPAVMAYPKAPAHYSVEMQRLYALGIDAFRVARQMNAGGASFELDGVTGRLRYDSQGPARIDRVSVAAQYRGGRPMQIKGPAGAN
jgi:outer membrane PBP1 activator LpoA protein